MNTNVTACLITYKRQHNIPKIVENLLRFPFISQIMIWDNSKQPNIINYARYVQAEKAENDYIYVQDDDWLVPELDKVYEKFLEDPTKLTQTGNKSYENDLKNNIYGDKQMAIVGWGTLFNRKWIPVLHKYTVKYNRDYCFLRETDRIFSILLNKHHVFVPTNVEELSDATSSWALSGQGDHLKYKKLAIERALAL